MGKQLSKLVASNSEKPASFNGLNIIRVQPSADGKFGGDILSIDSEQSFDHINSIVRILAAYVESSFQYSEANSETLAQYILYYNATHRKDIRFFQSKYNPELVKLLSPDKAGIDTSYRNWPGKTQIVIPIVSNILKDGGKDLTTDELESDVNRTVKNKEKDPDTREKMNSEAQKMDQLQKDKIQEEKKAVQDKKQELAQKEKDLANREKDNATKTAQASQILQELRKDPVKNAAKILEKEKEVQKLQEEKKQIQEEKKQVTQTKEELDKKEEELAKKEEARKEGGTAATSDGSKDSKEQSSAQKLDEVQRELAKVKDELQKKEEKSENVIDNKIFFMKFIKYDSDGHYSNELWAIDPIKDDALFKSPYSNICSKEFIEVPNQGVLVLGYEGTGKDDRKHKLTLLDTKTLKLKKQSDAGDIFWRTPMIYTDNKIYVIEKFENNYHISRFNPDLSLDIRSSDPIEENSEITFFKEKIYVTGKGKGEGKTTIKVFTRGDLKLQKTLAP